MSALRPLTRRPQRNRAALVWSWALGLAMLGVGYVCWMMGGW